jgi:biotin synthase
MAKEISISEHPGTEPFNIIAKASRGENLKKEEIIRLLGITDHDELQRLFAAADEVRKHVVGPEIFLRGIVEFSIFCERSCLYCGLRKENRQLKRYRIAEDDILAVAHSINAAHIATIVLQSGEDSFYTTDVLCRLIERIKAETALTVTLSIGERP